MNADRDHAPSSFLRQQVEESQALVGRGEDQADYVLVGQSTYKWDWSRARFSGQRPLINSSYLRRDPLVARAGEHHRDHDGPLRGVAGPLRRRPAAHGRALGSPDLPCARAAVRGEQLPTTSEPQTATGGAAAMSVAGPGWHTAACAENGVTGVGAGSRWTVHFGYAVVSPQSRNRIVGATPGVGGGLCGQGRAR